MSGILVSEMLRRIFRWRVLRRSCKLVSSSTFFFSFQNELFHFSVASCIRLGSVFAFDCFIIKFALQEADQINKKYSMGIL